MVILSLIVHLLTRQVIIWSLPVRLSQCKSYFHRRHVCLLYFNGFSHRIAKRSPDSGNCLEIIRNIVRESYEMRSVFPKNDRELLQIYLIISQRVDQQTSKEKLQSFCEACRRSWFDELDEDKHWFIPNIDIIERIVKDVVKLAWHYEPFSYYS